MDRLLYYERGWIENINQSPHESLIEMAKRDKNIRFKRIRTEIRTKVSIGTDHRP